MFIRSIASTMLVPVQHVQSAVDDLREYVEAPATASVEDVFAEANFKTSRDYGDILIESHAFPGFTREGFLDLMGVIAPYATGGIVYAAKGEQQMGCRFVDGTVSIVDAHVAAIVGESIYDITMKR